MCRFFFKVIQVLLIVVFLDILIGKLLSYLYFNESWGDHYRITYAMEETQADIIVFGSSRANHHFAPSIFEDSLNMSFYNTGRDGTEIFYHLGILKSVLNRHTPKIIILNVTGSFDHSKGTYDRISPLLPYYKTHPEIQYIVNKKSRFEKFFLLSNTYRFNSQLVTIVTGNIKNLNVRSQDFNGYIPLNGIWHEEAETNLIIPEYKIDTIKTNALIDFIHSCKRSKVQLIITISPTFKSYTKNYTTELCEKICKQESVPFYDFSSDSTFLKNRNLFYDPGHLNNIGAEIFSNKFIHKMKTELHIQDDY